MSRMLFSAVTFMVTFAWPHFTYADNGRLSDAALAEKRALTQMTERMARFEAAVAAADHVFRQMREHFAREEFKQAEELAPQSQELITRARRSWSALERLYTEAATKEMKFGRLIHVEYLNQFPSLQHYISMKVNNRFDHGSPLSYSFKTWRGLEFGEKVAEIPKSLKMTETIARFEFKHGDTVLIFFVNGGMIRGMIEGWTRNGDLILREVLPLGFVRLQKQVGHYRRLQPDVTDKISAIEIYRRRTPPTDGSPILPVVDRFGDYSTTLRSELYYDPQHLKLRPSDEEIFTAARGGELQTLLKSPELWPFKIGDFNRPRYPFTLFISCESDLR